MGLSRNVHLLLLIAPLALADLLRLLEEVSYCLILIICVVGFGVHGGVDVGVGGGHGRGGLWVVGILNCCIILRLNFWLFLGVKIFSERLLGLLRFHRNC